MIEMLGVLAIIGVLSVGGISGYSRAMAKYKLTKAQDQITMLLMNIRTAYATSPSYNGLTSNTAAEYAIAPGDMVIEDANGDKTLAGAFGGEVVVNSLGANNAYFYITMRALAQESCRSLLTSDWGADGLVMIKAGLDTGYAAPADNDIPCVANVAGGVFCTADLPVDLASAAQLCQSPGSYITWYYY